MSGLERFKGDSPIRDIVGAIRRDGAAIVENYVDDAVADQVRDDLREPFDKVGRSTESDFNGYTTLRVNSVLDISPASAGIVGHRGMMRVLDAILLDHCTSYLIGSCTAIEIHPGETGQVLHRDDTIYPVQKTPGIELQVSVMWALETFTDINGATRIVPDSHRWPPSRTPGPDDTVLAAEMPKGSALFYLGSVWHGGGANRDRRPRAGLINTYCLGWLRQEVNHFLAVPRATAAALPEHVQRLMGYSLYDGMLGYYPTDHGRVPLGDMRGGAMWGWQTD
ncbi:MAG: phytanoyl-CoA dioxygenase family protein [Alphaproteobacteria bacterium]|nr:phytanoyl-CoA dioxygenase family protein [Alphaproteobacteria bacterium]